MRRVIRNILAGLLALSLIFSQAVVALAENSGSGYTPDQRTSERLTDYLKNHKLPLVGAQVLKDAGGDKSIVLYGYTATEFGKKDATAKARSFLHDSTAAVDNRIKVRPELLASGNTGSAAPASSAPPSDEAASSPDNSAYPDANSYAQRGNDIQQYNQQANRGAAASALTLPLILGMMALSMASGGSFQFGSGGIGPGGMGGGIDPFGPPQPYNPYPGYPSIPPPNSSSPYGDPYGP